MAQFNIRVIKMQSEQQFEQLMLQYTQLKNGSQDISQMIDNEDYDSAITMIKNRENIFLNCKCMRRFLELTPEQEEKLNILLEELKKSEEENMAKLQKGMDEVQSELKKIQTNQKIKNVYKNNQISQYNSLDIKE